MLVLCEKWIDGAQAVIELRLQNVPHTAIEVYQWLQQFWKPEQMNSIRDFLPSFNKKDVVPTVEAKQSKASHHDKHNDILKLGYTLPNLANICLHKSLDAEVYQFAEGDEDVVEKMQEDAVCLSVVFVREAVVKETVICKPTNLCKSIVGIDANQLYSYTMCQPMPTGQYTGWDLDLETSGFTPRQTRPAALKIWSYPIFK